MGIIKTRSEYLKESVWGGMLSRSTGETIRKEDEMTDADFDFLTDCLIEFATRVVWDGVKVGFKNLSDCIRKQSNDYKDINVENVISYVDRNWTTVSKELDDFIDDEEKEKREGMNESVWGGMLSRSTGDVKRKEDEYHPEYFDFGEGTTVYWATNNLEIDGKIEFQFEEIKDYNNNGWRLPTEEEVKQLKWIKPYTNLKNNCIDFLVRGPQESRGKYLKLTRDYKGIGSTGTTISKRNGTLSHMWTSTVSKFDSNYSITYGFDNTPAFCPLSTLKDERLPVFLVKDKKSEN